VALESSLRRAGLEGLSRADLVLALLRRPDEIESELAALLESGVAVELERGLLLHAESLQAGREAILSAVRASHERNPLALGLRKADLANKVRARDAVTDGLVQRLARDGEIELLSQGRLRVTDFRPSLSSAQALRRQRILDLLAADPWQTPRSNDMPRMIEALPDESDKLIALLEDEGLVVKLRDGVLFLTSTIDEAKATLREHLAENASLAPADLKQLFGITRKYGIPLLEHLDVIGFTRRDGDRRLLR
jgi:selenocysteine-specific elongation factor